MAIALAAVAAAVLLGSWIYWAGEGGGSPAEFRERVNDTGLTVAWDNNGPRGGDGIVDTECGPIEVSVQLWADDLLTVRWNNRSVTLTPDNAAAFVRCDLP